MCSSVNTRWKLVAYVDVMSKHTYLTHMLAPYHGQMVSYKNRWSHCRGRSREYSTRTMSWRGYDSIDTVCMVCLVLC